MEDIAWVDIEVRETIISTQYCLSEDYYGVAEAKEKVNHFEGGLWNSFKEIKVLVRGEKL